VLQPKNLQRVVVVKTSVTELMASNPATSKPMLTGYMQRFVAALLL
jgi:hypothetical protein